MKKQNSHCLIRLFLLFALSVTVPMISYSYLPRYGLFGELQSLVVVNENKEEISEVSSKITVRKKQKGNNRINLWLFVLAHITCLRLLAKSARFPKADTIIVKKVRMNH